MEAHGTEQVTALSEYPTQTCVISAGEAKLGKPPILVRSYSSRLAGLWQEGSGDGRSRVPSGEAPFPSFTALPGKLLVE